MAHQPVLCSCLAICVKFSAEYQLLLAWQILSLRPGVAQKSNCPRWPVIAATLLSFHLLFYVPVGGTRSNSPCIAGPFSTRPLGGHDSRQQQRQLFFSSCRVFQFAAKERPSKRAGTAFHLTAIIGCPCLFTLRTMIHQDAAHKSAASTH